jgi:hypothetical protein
MEHRNLFTALAVTLALCACAGTTSRKSEVALGNPTIACTTNELVCSGHWGSGCYVAGANSCFDGKVCKAGEALCVVKGQAECYNPSNKSCR